MRASAAKARVLHLHPTFSCRRLGRIRLAAAFTGWQQHVSDLAAARQTAERLGAVHDAALVADCFGGWAEQAVRRAQQQQALVALVARRAAWLQLNVLHQWQAWAQHQQAQRAQLQRAVRKLAGMRHRHAFGAWRAVVEERHAAEQRLAVVQRRLAARAAVRTLGAAFRCWRSHTASLAAARAAVDAKVAAENAVVRRHSFAAWRGATEAQAERHEHLLRVCVERRAAGLQSTALFAWQLFAQVGGVMSGFGWLHATLVHLHAAPFRCLTRPRRPPSRPHRLAARSARRTTGRRWR